MPVWKAVLLGVIQGVTSVLPVSSSGHIALFGRLLDEPSASSLSFMVYLHIGTLAAVLWTFRRDVLRILVACLQILIDLFRNTAALFGSFSRSGSVAWRQLDGNNYRRLAVLLLVSAATETAVSLAIRNFSFLGASNLLITAMGFFVTALLLLISSYTVGIKNNPMRTNYRDAVLAGAFQGAAGLPGISRLGMALSAGSLAGMEDPYMVRFAFLAAVPGIFGGLIAVLPSAQAQTEASVGVGPCIAGILTAAVVSGVMLRLIRKALSRRLNRAFAVYAVVAGILCITMYFR